MISTGDEILEYLNQIQYTIEELKCFFDDEEIEIVFRGEPDNYNETKLMPSLFRQSTPSNIGEHEKKILESVQDYKVAGIGASNLHKSIDAQHYLAQSRLLDISFNALIALFFALDTYDEASGAKPRVYVIAIPREFVFSSNSKYINTYFDNISDDSDDMGISDNHKLLSYAMLNERITAQDGGFILFPGKYFSPIPEMFYKPVEVIGGKSTYLKSLNNIFNITKSKVYPEKSYKGDKIKIEIERRDFHESMTMPIHELELLGRKYLFELNHLKKFKDTESELLKRRIQRIHKKTFCEKADELRHRHASDKDIIEQINEVENDYLTGEILI